MVNQYGNKIETSGWTRISYKEKDPNKPYGLPTSIKRTWGYRRGCDVLQMSELDENDNGVFIVSLNDEGAIVYHKRGSIQRRLTPMRSEEFERKIFPHKRKYR